MRISWERVAAVVLSVGVWAVVLVGGRHMIHLLRGDLQAFAHLATGGRRFT
jgi:hypothetical protein